MTLSYQKKEGEGDFDLKETRILINSFGVDGGRFRVLAQKYLPDSLFGEFKAFLSQTDRVIQNMLSTARVALDLFFDENVCEITNECDLKISDLREKNTIIYLICDEARIRYYSLLFNLFYSACFEYLLTHYKSNSRPVFFLLDEFANLGKILDFNVVATTLRKRKCSLSLILQDVSQLYSVYGKTEAETILGGGVNSRLFFGGCGLETTEYVERLLGASTETERVYQGEGREDRFLISGKALMTRDQIRMLPRNQAILISSNLKPIRFVMQPYWLDIDLPNHEGF